MVCDDKWHSVVRVLFFILEEIFSVNTTCFVKTMVNASIVVTSLFQMTFQFPKTFFGGSFIAADAFDSESLAVIYFTCIVSLYRNDPTPRKIDR